MTSRMHTAHTALVLATVAATLTLAACSSEPEPEPSPTEASSPLEALLQD